MFSFRNAPSVTACSISRAVYPPVRLLPCASGPFSVIFTVSQILTHPGDDFTSTTKVPGIVALARWDSMGDGRERHGRHYFSSKIVVK